MDLLAPAEPTTDDLRAQLRRARYRAQMAELAGADLLEALISTQDELAALRSDAAAAQAARSLARVKQLARHWMRDHTRASVAGNDTEESTVRALAARELIAVIGDPTGTVRTPEWRTGTTLPAPTRRSA